MEAQEIIDLYLRVGLFFGWTFQEFWNTPVPLVKELEKEMGKYFGRPGDSI